MGRGGKDLVYLSSSLDSRSNGFCFCGPSLFVIGGFSLFLSFFLAVSSLKKDCVANEAGLDFSEPRAGGERGRRVGPRTNGSVSGSYGPYGPYGPMNPSSDRRDRGIVGSWDRGIVLIAGIAESLDEPPDRWSHRRIAGS